MYTIIRNVCEVEPPKNGWGKQPNDNDTKISDDIERIRHKRNLICHETALNMETSDFNKSALDLIRVFKSNTKQIEAFFFLISDSFLLFFSSGYNLLKNQNDSPVQENIYIFGKFTFKFET